MLFDQLCVLFRSVVVICYSISCVTFSISCGCMLFDQLCNMLFDQLSFFDQLWLNHMIDQLLIQLWLHVIRSVVCLFSISCGYMLFDQLCVFFDQLWLYVIRSVV